MIHVIQVFVAVPRQKHCSCTDPSTHRSHRWTLCSLPPQLRVLLRSVHSKLHQCKRNCVFPVCHGGHVGPSLLAPASSSLFVPRVGVRATGYAVCTRRLQETRYFLSRKLEKNILTLVTMYDLSIGDLAIGDLAIERLAIECLPTNFTKVMKKRKKMLRRSSFSSSGLTNLTVLVDLCPMVSAWFFHSSPCSARRLTKTFVVA